MGVTHYVALWCPDFPLQLIEAIASVITGAKIKNRF
jgi:hypothetical protein